MISGRIILSNGQPATHVKVQCFNHLIGKADILLGSGQVESDIDGRYQLSFSSAGSGDLYLLLESDTGAHQRTPTQTYTNLEGTSEASIDVVLTIPHQGSSAFERHDYALTDALSGELLTQQDLEGLPPEDIELLLTKTNGPKENIAQLISSHLLSNLVPNSAKFVYGLGTVKTVEALLWMAPNEREQRLTQAVQDGLLVATEAERADFNSQLDDLAINQLGRDASLGPASERLGKIYAHAGITGRNIERANRVLLNHQGTAELFWQSIGATNIPEGKSNRLKNVSIIYSIVGQNEQLAEAILTVAPSNLGVAVDAQELHALVVSTGGVPNEVAASGITVDEYVHEIFAQLEEFDPVGSLHKGIGGFGLATDPMITFVQQNLDFDVLGAELTAGEGEYSDRLDAFIGINPGDVPTEPQKEARKALDKKVKQVQRLYRVAPHGHRVETTRVLYQSDIQGSHGIVEVGADGIAQMLVEGLGVDVELAGKSAQDVVDAAGYVVARTVANWGERLSTPPFRGIPNRDTVEVTGYQVLFGAQDTCACRHCRSALSPAAYLVDLLQWLKKQQQGALFGPLNSARADISQLKLSCSNSHTQIPYIDLVIEQLEKRTGPIEITTETIGSKALRRAHPQHLPTEPYRILSEAITPFNLPYGLWQDESRTYLGQLGISRADWMRLGTLTPSTDEGAERLGVTLLGWNLITGAEQHSVASIWGRELAELVTISVFLKQASDVTGSFKIEDLFGLLRSSYIQGIGERLGIWFDGEKCDPTTGIITGLSESHLDRMHRFLRLQRAIGWSTQRLDHAIRVLGMLNPQPLERIVELQHLATVTGLSVEELLAWFGQLDTTQWERRLIAGIPVGAVGDGHGLIFQPDYAWEEEAVAPTQYGQLFLQDGLSEAPSEAFRPEAGLGVQLGGTGEPITAHQVAIAGALSVEATELTALLSEADSLSLATLSQYYRVVSFARSQRLTIAELLSVISLTGIDPFESPTQAALLVAELQANRDVGVSLITLQDLLGGQDTKPSSLRPRRADTEQSLRRIGAAMSEHLTEELEVFSAALDQLLAQDLGLKTTTARGLRVLLSEEEIAELRALSSLDAETAPGEEAVRLFERLHQAAALLRALAVPEAEEAWIITHAPTLGFEILQLPLSPDDSAIEYQAWVRLRGLVQFSRQCSVGILDAYQSYVDDVTDTHTFAKAIAEQSRWSVESLEFLIQTQIGEVGENRDNIEAFTQLRPMLNMVRRSGLPAEVLWQARSRPQTVEDQQALALQIKQAVRARYDEARWLKVAGTLRDDIRVRQRDALLAYVIADSDSSIAEVADQILLDVLMAPCQFTSRIKQANASIQRYIQRITLNLESDLEMAPDKRAEWSWLKNYRVWEANRKVLLYPENWLDPDIRHDVSPAFEQLKLNISKVVDQDSAEAVFATYLDEVGVFRGLEPLGMFGHEESLLIVARDPESRKFYAARVRESQNDRYEVEHNWELLPLPSASGTAFATRINDKWAVIAVEITELPVQIPEPSDGGPPVSVSLPVRVVCRWATYQRGRWTSPDENQFEALEERLVNADEVSSVQHHLRAISSLRVQRGTTCQVSFSGTQGRFHEQRVLRVRQVSGLHVASDLKINVSIHNETRQSIVLRCLFPFSGSATVPRIEMPTNRMHFKNLWSLSRGKFLSEWKGTEVYLWEVAGFFESRSIGPFSSFIRHDEHRDNNAQLDLKPFLLSARWADPSTYGHPLQATHNLETAIEAPRRISAQLAAHGRYAEALEWLSYLIVPTQENPFASRAILTVSADSYPDELDIRAWQASPFDPYAIQKVRPAALSKRVMMDYLDLLIDWADQLFRRDTMESTQEAMQLYRLAASLLGKRPERVPMPEGETHSYNELANLDELSNVSLTENNIPRAEPHRAPAIPVITFQGSTSGGSQRTPSPFTKERPPSAWAPSLLFCVPENPNLWAYWDTLADRVFKLRNCMNIEGLVRELALFEPPIDPALLIRAAAAGVDFASAVSMENTPRSALRFEVCVSHALRICGDVQALGQTLLSALEKEDAEQLAQLRVLHEAHINEQFKITRQLQIKEASAALDAAERGRDSVTKRFEYYSSRQRVSQAEQSQLDQLKSSNSRAQEATGLRIASQALIGPRIEKGISGVGAYLSVGLSEILLKSTEMGATALEGYSRWLSTESTIAAIRAGHSRRKDDWNFQAKQAKADLKAIEKQIIGAELRHAMAEHEASMQETRIEQSTAVAEFMQNKFSAPALYQWLAGELSRLYFSAYNLAYELAKKAELAWQHEIGDEQTFISYGHWDGLKKGLLAGEKLRLDLNRMLTAFQTENTRELELTRHFSLAELDPTQLIKLRRTGSCTIELSEALFDLDTPGHYFRRLKSVAISLPSVTGPYTPVHCQLTLLSSKIRKNTNLIGINNTYAEMGDPDPRFTSDGSPASIMTSSANQDSGLFETRLEDPRFLPFDRRGAVSDWTLTLPQEFRRFDYQTISDVVLHVRYTARDGGEVLRAPATDHLNAQISAVANGFVFHHLFSADPAAGEIHEDLSKLSTFGHAIAVISRNLFFIPGDDPIVLEAPEVDGIHSFSNVPENTRSVWLVISYTLNVGA